MGLIFPGILAGLGALALPFLIHLIRSRKFRRVEIGTLRFLRAAVRERRRFRKVENWPLLLVRLLLVALITLLFARPFLPAHEEITPEDLEAVLLVDVSGSVSGEHFSAVRDAVTATLAKVPPGAKVTIAPFADAVRPLHAGPVSELEPTPLARTDYTKAVNWTLDHLAQSERRHAQVYFIGDLQKAGLPATPPRVWPANVRTSVVPVPPAGLWNVAITSVELLTPFASAEAEIEATVLITGAAPSEERQVTCELEGKPLEPQKITPAGGRVRFRWKPGSTLQFQGTVSVASSDTYPGDNRRPFAVRLAQPKRVRLIEGSLAASAFEADSYFLKKALTVSGRERGPSPFAAEVAPDPAGMAPGEVAAFCDVAGVSPALVPELAEAVRSGGAAAFFLGKNTRPAQFAALAAAGLFPEKLEAINVPAPRAIDSWDKEHPALAAFDGRERGDLRSILLRDAFLVEGGPDWKVLARLENGHPALLAREFGKGRVLVYTNPLTRVWSDLPRERIFLPLIKEWFTWLTRLDLDAQAPHEVLAGIHETRPPGVYPAADRLEVVVPDPAEMDITTATPDAVRRALALPDEHSTAVLPEGGQTKRARQNELWPWLALAVLLALLLENRLADRSRVAKQV
jgi:hypothetical protein